MGWKRYKLLVPWVEDDFLKNNIPFFFERKNNIPLLFEISLDKDISVVDMLWTKMKE
jgi:hypothetical protein